MGSADSKAKSDSSRCDVNSAPEDLLDSSLSSSGIRLHHVDSNNFLGRLQDAERFAEMSIWHRLLMFLGRFNTHSLQKENRQATLEQLVEQQEQLAQAQQDCCSACSTVAQSSITGQAPGSGSQRCPNHRCSCDGSGSDTGVTGPTVDELSMEAQHQDLTTLLRQGFDPTAYEKRQLLARFAQPEKYGFDPRAV